MSSQDYDKEAQKWREDMFLAILMAHSLSLSGALMVGVRMTRRTNAIVRAKRLSIIGVSFNKLQKDAGVVEEEIVFYKAAIATALTCRNDADRSPAVEAMASATNALRTNCPRAKGSVYGHLVASMEGVLYRKALLEMGVHQGKLEAVLSNIQCKMKHREILWQQGGKW